MSAGLLFDALVIELNPQGIAVVFGTGKADDQYPAEATVMISCTPAGDQIGDAKGTQDDTEEPRAHDVAEGLTVRIEGSASAAGATYRDHYDAVKSVRDRALVAIRNWARAAKSGYEIARAGWMDPPNENPQGARYEIGLRIADQVLDTHPPTVSDVPYLVTQKLIVAGTATDFPGAPPVPPPAP